MPVLVVSDPPFPVTLRITSQVPSGNECVGDELVELPPSSNVHA